MKWNLDVRSQDRQVKSLARKFRNTRDLVRIIRRCALHSAKRQMDVQNRIPNGHRSNYYLSLVRGYVRRKGGPEVSLASTCSSVLGSPATWSATVVSTRVEIEDLKRHAPHLFRDLSTTLHPEFFLASISWMAWIPRVVVVMQSDEIVGIVYAKERSLAGIPTGLVHADATLGEMVASATGWEEPVFRRAVSALLTAPGIRGVRISVPPDSFETAAAREIASSLGADVSQAPLENHVVLSLPPCYGDFVNGLSSKTRRNFRYYRRRCEAAGHRHVDGMSMSQFSDAAARLLEKSVTGADREGITRAKEMLSLAHSPLLAGLQTREGEWIGILGGWCEGERAVLFFQMNDDRDHAGDSLCVVLRGYLIEHLIARGIRSLLFWAGAGRPYSDYSQPVPAVALYLDRRSPLWRACRSLIRAVGPVWPRRFAWVADWIVCSPKRSSASNGSSLY
jgi:hypothetical protein